MMRNFQWIGVLFLLQLSSLHGSEHPVVVEPPHGVRAETLGLVVNEADPLSVKIAEYYSKVHKVPGENLIKIRLPVDQGSISRETFEQQYQQVKSQTPDHIQAYALAWWRPYKVDCLSITTAFTFGFDVRYCATGCKPTRASPYFASASPSPWRDHKIRPSMLIAANSQTHAQQLIDRGLQSIGSWPSLSKGFVLKTADKNRSVRGFNDKTLERLNQIPQLSVEQKAANELSGEKDLMFYFTGATHVADIERNDFLPGAMGDHLTSVGGVLEGTGQMSALQWLEQGATGSYGTVAEPCNFTTKFPNPQIAMAVYTRGETLLEAYWKSVAMPGQGVFLGDPLARPWAGTQTTRDGEWVKLTSRRWSAGFYGVIGSESPDGPYVGLGQGQLPPNDFTLELKVPRKINYFQVLKLKKNPVKTVDKAKP